MKNAERIRVTGSLRVVREIAHPILNQEPPIDERLRYGRVHSGASFWDLMNVFGDMSRVAWAPGSVSRIAPYVRGDLSARWGMQ